ncbi:MAG: hypothetical protein NC120_09755 [Ruminococcus sp.]|nr:hypothetical protein [Ruminococcus sp.]
MEETNVNNDGKKELSVEEGTSVPPCGEEDGAEALGRENARLKAENTALRHRISCLENGIPGNIAEDMICIAERRCERENCDFDTAVRDAYERISGFAAARSHGVTTGVRSRSGGRSSDDTLRHAFGLRER